MIPVTDPSNESMREIIKVTGDVSEAVPLSLLKYTLVELVTRPEEARRAPFETASIAGTKTA